MCIEYFWCALCRYWFVETSRPPMVWLNIVVQTSHKSRCLCRGSPSFWMQPRIATFTRLVTWSSWIRPKLFVLSRGLCVVPLPLTLTTMARLTCDFEVVLQAGCHFWLSKNGQSTEGIFLVDLLHAAVGIILSRLSVFDSVWCIVADRCVLQQKCLNNWIGSAL